jgi:type IV pilus assembly protein PilN
MAQINLLPPEIRRRRQARRQAVMLAAGVLGIVVLLLVFYGVQAGRLSAANSGLTRQRATNARLQAEVDQLSHFSQLQQQLANKKQLLVTLTQNEVRWSTVLADIATFIPDDVWVTQFNGTVQVQAPNAQTTSASGAAVATTYGSLQLGGCTLAPPDGTHLSVARWLVRLGAPREFVNAYLTLSAKGSAACPVTFNTSVNLDDQSLRRNQRGGARNP